MPLKCGFGVIEKCFGQFSLLGHVLLLYVIYSNCRQMAPAALHA